MIDTSKMSLSELAIRGLLDNEPPKWKTDFSGPTPASWGRQMDEPMDDEEWARN